jgi:2-(1,2-epoxy-1,2-dihydrophenyl)acetyl-CoA isomerase
MSATEDGPEPTTYGREEHVGIITLNRPARLNALTAELLVSLRRRFAEAECDPKIHSILLTGAGGAFCAGQDLNDRDPRKVVWPLDLEAIQKEYFHPIILAMKTSSKPIVVGVNGVASGAGVGLALAGDIVIASDTAHFALSFAKVGLSADAGCGWHLVNTLGAPRARALLLTGASISAPQALELGLIWRRVPQSELTHSALEIARSLAQGPTVAFGLIKKAVALAENHSLEEYLSQEALLQGIAGASEDYREGVLSFLEKRSAKFVGR